VDSAAERVEFELLSASKLAAMHDQMAKQAESKFSRLI
jgi:hypothetical protein